MATIPLFPVYMHMCNRTLSASKGGVCFSSPTLGLAYDLPCSKQNVVEGMWYNFWAQASGGLAASAFAVLEHCPETTSKEVEPSLGWEATRKKMNKGALADRSADCQTCEGGHLRPSSWMQSHEWPQVRPTERYAQPFHKIMTNRKSLLF